MVRKRISIGVQAACMFDCEARVPLMVYAKLRGIMVKDPVDLAVVRRGRLIHEVFQAVATRMAGEDRITDSVAVKQELAREITIAMPELDTSVVSQHATKLASAIRETATTTPAETITHERRVSVPLTEKVKLSGRIDTIAGDASGRVIIERKSGEARPWHAAQVQLYAEMLVAMEPETKIDRLELWYSRFGTRVVPCTSGELLAGLTSSAARGEALTEKGAVAAVESWCAACPRVDCGVKRICGVLGISDFNL